VGCQGRGFAGSVSNVEVKTWMALIYKALFPSISTFETPPNGKRHYLWRAVDQDDNVLDILVQSRRNKQAAKKFFRKLLKGLTYVPRVVITDKLKSYGAAKREILPGIEHRQSRYLNNPTTPFILDLIVTAL
jgi:DDE domain